MGINPLHKKLFLRYIEQYFSLNIIIFVPRQLAENAKEKSSNIKDKDFSYKKS